MPTPALKPFLDATGRIVHDLNSVVVGLSAVESGAATKPVTMDISWTPRDSRASSRQARTFVLSSTLVFLAEEISAYLDQLMTFPGVNHPEEWDIKNKAQRLSAMWHRANLEEDFILAGALLVTHWRNRIIHRKSNARLTDSQQKLLLNASRELGEKYKNLDPHRTLNDFEKGTPTLKDVSSLTAMTIRCVRRLDDTVPEPKNAEELNKWLSVLGLSDALNRVQRVSAAKGKEATGVATFLRTNCPALLHAYLDYAGSAD